MELSLKQPVKRGSKCGGIESIGQRFRWKDELADLSLGASPHGFSDRILRVLRVSSEAGGERIFLDLLSSVEFLGGETP